MKIGARNQIEGQILSVTPEAVNASVKVDIGGGRVITSSITNEAVEELALVPGNDIVVIIKSTDVMIGK